MHADDHSSPISVVSATDGDCYHDEEDMMMVIDWDDEEADVDSVSTTEELLSFLESAIGLWEDTGIDDVLLEHPVHDHLREQEPTAAEGAPTHQSGEIGPSSKQ